MIKSHLLLSLFHALNLFLAVNLAKCSFLKFFFFIQVVDVVVVRRNLLGELSDNAKRSLGPDPVQILQKRELFNKALKAASYD